jgi:hypothetical protein
MSIARAATTMSNVVAPRVLDGAIRQITVRPQADPHPRVRRRISLTDLHKKFRHGRNHCSTPYREFADIACRAGKTILRRAKAAKFAGRNHD